jgi:hypothetical protein
MRRRRSSSRSACSRCRPPRDTRPLPRLARRHPRPNTSTRQLAERWRRVSEQKPLAPRDWAEQEERYRPPVRLRAAPSCHRRRRTCSTSAAAPGCSAGSPPTPAHGGSTPPSPWSGIAQERVPDGEFPVGDGQFLPYRADTVDVVAGFNSIQYAADARKGGGSFFRTWRARLRCSTRARRRCRSSRWASCPPAVLVAKQVIRRPSRSVSQPQLRAPSGEPCGGRRDRRRRRTWW